MQLLITAICFFSLLLTALAWQKSKNNHFYQDTPLLWPFGVYIWGDGLVIAPFFAVASALWLILGTEPSQMVRFLVLALGVRSFFEVIYWLNHQAVRDPFIPPLFRNISWLRANDVAILFQVFHTAIVIFCAAFLLGWW